MFGIVMNRWVIGGIVTVLLLAGVWWKGYGSGKETVQREWAQNRAQQELARAKLVDLVRKTEQQLQQSADQHQQEKRDALDRLTRQHRAVLDSLRDRPQRPAPGAVPDRAEPAQSQPGCTGAELHREDAEFLVGEAARADTLRAELEACYVQYDAVRATR
jgi:hypothetical protein